MLRFRAAFLALLVVVVASPSGHAVTLLTAILTHEQETVQGPFLTSSGDPRPVSFGTASFVLNDEMTALTFTATIFNIDIDGTQTPDDPNDDLGAAHIHAPAPPGSNGGVVWGFFGGPDNDIDPDDLVVTPLASGVGGVFSSKWDLDEGNGGTTLTEQIPNILAGLAYINFHTNQFGGGEIRGQLNVVPEPSSIVMLGTGAVAVLGLRWRRMRTRATQPG